MRVLVTGHRGVLGGALMAELKRRGHEAVGADVAEMDVADAARVTAVVDKARPAAVVNCAAFTRVDDCESNRDLCFQINASGAENVAIAAREFGARVIHLSTDYVFDGKTETPYREDAAPAPLSVYAESKLAGEEAVAATCEDRLIVRTAWLFGVGGVNFISRILTRAKAGEPLAVVADQRGSPSYAGHVAAGIVDLLAVPYRGVVHVVGAGVASWFDVAAEVLRRTGINVPLEKITTADLGPRAPRPAYSALDTALYTELTGKVTPPWREGVAEYLALIKESA